MELPQHLPGKWQVIDAMADAYAFVPETLYAFHIHPDGKVNAKIRKAGHWLALKDTQLVCRDNKWFIPMYGGFKFEVENISQKQFTISAVNGYLHFVLERIVKH